MLLIRAATTDDIPVIQHIAHTTWPIAYGHIISAEQIAYMLEMMYSTDALAAQMNLRMHRFLIATLDAVAVGFASYELDINNAARITKLHKLYCLPSEQKNGVGISLVNAVITAASQQSTIQLNVNKNNNATNFYARLGFSVIGEIVVDIGQGYVMDDYVMAKQLSRPTIATEDVK